MEITDYILLNMLKTQLVDMYRSFNEDSSLLVDVLPSKEVYGKLVKSNTLASFKQWLKQASVSGFSFTNTDGLVFKNYFLGEFIDLAMEANDATLMQFVEWKSGVTPENVEQAEEKNAKIVSALLEKLKGKRDVHVVIFPCGNQWAALDADAERLFQLFGWQTGYVLSEDFCHVPFMNITKYGFEVLKLSPYVVEILDIDGSAEIVSESFLEDETSCAQQMIDYIRLLQDDIKKITAFSKKEFPIVTSHGMYPRLLQVLNVEISRKKITTRLDVDKKMTVVDGSDWRLDEIGLPIVCRLGKYLGDK